MEDKELQVTSAIDLPVQGSGSILAVERKRQNKTVEEIANELNLTITQLRSIELDQTDGLPEPTYVRGYIRSYANLLDLDPDEVLKNYLNPNWQQSSKLDEMPRGIGSADEYTGNRGSKLKMFAGFLLFGAVAAGVWFSGYLDEWIGRDAAVETAVTSTVGDSPNTDEVANPELNDEVDLSDSIATEQFDEIETSEVEADPAPVAVSSTNELILNFTQTSWIDIRDGADNRLAYKSYVAGEELVVSSEGLMSVFIGNAEGVTVRYNGAQFDISQYREGVYAKFVVNEE